MSNNDNAINQTGGDPIDGAPGTPDTPDTPDTRATRGTSDADAEAAEAAPSATPTPKPTSASPDLRETLPHHASEESTARRFLPLMIVGAVVAVAAAGFGVWQTSQTPEAQVTPPAVTITNPLPTAELTPIEPDIPTPLGDLLPRTTLQYALTEANPEESKGTARALESYSLTYTQGEDSSATAGSSIVVDVTRWSSVEEANAHRAALDEAAAAADPEGVVSQGPVQAGGDQVGEFLMRTGADSAIVVWTNGTTVLRATGPAATVPNFYLAFAI